MNSRSERQPYRPTTTHAGWGEGDPHLTVTRDDERFVFALTTEIVRIGSAADNELRLDETDPVHAEIAHDDRDEYVLTMHGEGETSARTDVAATGTDDDSMILRTGARFTAGPWTLVFGRAESSDHGRPYGGRVGGEFSDQREQPSRPDYAQGAYQASDDDRPPQGGADEVKDG